MTKDEDHAVGLWMNHSNFLWSQLQTAASVEGAILVGWYTLRSGQEPGLSSAILVVGSVLLLLLAWMMHRHGQHVDAFREAARSAIPKPEKPLLGIRGRYLALSTPIILAMFNIVLLFWPSPGGAL